jgi:hypothetical protein
MLTTHISIVELSKFIPRDQLDTFASRMVSLQHEVQFFGLWQNDELKAAQDPSY